MQKESANLKLSNKLQALELRMRVGELTKKCGHNIVFVIKVKIIYKVQMAVEIGDFLMSPIASFTRSTPF